MGKEIEYNPDILTCLSNLSNDEVFTPPELANEVLDMIPESFWSDPNVKVLDPCAKSGVFLREVAKRFIKGLENKIPDLQERVNHIFHKQLYGIAITELTGHLARRSLYCSKNANGDYSVSKFNSESGNIIYNNIRHTWDGKNCKYCGAAKSEYNRDHNLEQHAYEFIHLTAKRFKELQDMHFDLIIGNPPYQLSDGGHGPSAIPIYQKFVEQAKKLKPRFLTMIVPSRWFSGGRGLDDFREEMLHDNHLRVIHDYFDASTCFPGVEIKGGICYFLWDRDHGGLCHVVTHRSDDTVIESERPLLEPGMTIFLRDVEQIAILKKVQNFHEKSFADIVTANDPFGFDVREPGSYKRVKPTFSMKPFDGAVDFYYNGWRKNGIGYMERSSIKKNQDFIDKYKIFVPKAWGTGDSSTDWLNCFIVNPNSASTETYLTTGPFETLEEATNAYSYMQTKFFHFMVSMVKITQNAMKNIYTLVPIQDFTKQWKDEDLYKKYNLTDKEIAFIESNIRPASTKE